MVSLSRRPFRKVSVLRQLFQLARLRVSVLRHPPLAQLFEQSHLSLGDPKLNPLCLHIRRTPIAHRIQFEFPLLRADSIKTQRRQFVRRNPGARKYVLFDRHTLSQKSRVRPLVARARWNRLIATALARKQTVTASTTRRQSWSTVRQV